MNDMTTTSIWQKPIDLASIAATGKGTAVELRIPADATVTGSARDLYLSLWNRGRGAAASDPDWWADWAEHVKVTWA